MEHPFKLRSDGKEREYRQHRLVALAMLILETLLVLVIIFLLLFRPVKVQGASMEPALLRDELLLIDKVALYIQAPQRGDMVVFSHPANQHEELIKRVVALPNETIAMLNGQVYINGLALDESVYPHISDGNMDPITVPDGYVFVLGDNRPLSQDSRDPAIGCIPISQLHGKVRFRIAPLSRINLFL